MLVSEEERGVFSEPPTADKLYYRFAMTQPLFHWGVISRNVESAKIRRNIEDGRTRQAFAAVAKDIRGKYLELLIQNKFLERVRFNLSNVAENLKESADKRLQNLISEAEIYQIRIGHQRAVLWEAMETDTYETGLRMLSRISGVSVSDEMIADEFPDLP
ncbi:MAG: TolC family protein [Candidatus Synoicihabitans palmerolidicus]|nr:TolC family protein [Candidatus Synoicihabitans palmerolidicus]